MQTGKSGKIISKSLKVWKVREFEKNVVPGQGKSFNPSAQSDNKPTIVDQVIVPGPSVRSLRYSSGVSRVYFVNLYSFTPLPL